jgi:hypothetical protein
MSLVKIGQALSLSFSLAIYIVGNNIIMDALEKPTACLFSAVSIHCGSCSCGSGCPGSNAALKKKYNISGRG